MTKEDILQMLESNRDSRGEAVWSKSDPSKGKWTSFGLGLTKLRKMARKVGRDHDLALILWEEPNFDCKILATLIDEPKKITPEQVEYQVGETGFWLLSHSYCGNLMRKVAFLKDKAVEWARSEDDVRRRCGYLLLCSLAKDDKGLTDKFFEKYLATIEKDIGSEENFVKDAMNNALLAIGSRSEPLRQKAMTIAKKIGRIEVDYGDNACQAVDVAKHLSSESIMEKTRAASRK